MNEAIGMLIEDKSDTQLLEVLTTAMKDNNNELLSYLEDDGYASRPEGKANLAVVETIVEAVYNRMHAGDEEDDEKSDE